MNEDFNQMNNSNSNFQGYKSMDYKSNQINNSMNNNSIIELNNYKKENLRLKKQINKLQQENHQLNNDLKKANQMIISIQQKEIDYNNQINNLKIKLKDKEIEINNLTKKTSNNDNSKKYVDYNNIIVVHFISGDGRINYGIKCLKTDTFAEVEEKLYQVYDEFRETNNIFLANGNIVKRFKKMSENNIKNGDKIQLQNPVFE